VWVVWPPEQPSPPSTAAAAAAAKSTAGQSTASSSIGRRLLQQDASSSSSSSSNSADASASSGYPFGHVQVVGVHSSSLKLPFNSQLGAYAEALYEQRASKASSSPFTAAAAAAAAAEAATADTTDASGGSTLRSRLQSGCVGGAGGREPDGVNVLLPVAVPFTADTYAWIEDVLQQHTCWDG
jgi:hypothetical protein